MEEYLLKVLRETLISGNEKSVCTDVCKGRMLRGEQCVMGESLRGEFFFKNLASVAFFFFFKAFKKTSCK